MAKFDKIVCIGGAGFLGSEILRQFKSMTNNIIVVDNFRTGFRDREELKYVDVIEQDICDLSGDWVRTLRRANLVIHLAANIDTPWSVNHMLEDFKLNTLGTTNVVNACITANVPKIIYASSAAIYGAVVEDRLPITEDIYPEPASPYAKSKFQGEIEVLAGARTYGYDAHCLRMFNLYGPRESANTLDEVFLYTLYVLKGKEIPIFGEPVNQLRDYISVSDAANAFVLAAETGQKGSHFYNVCTGKGTNFAELIRLIEDHTGIKAKTKILPLRPGELTKSWGIYEKAKRVLGFEPKVDIESGVKQMVQWVRSAPIDILQSYKLG
ncbi:NAD-dependent epimerase/dehydratase family protein [Chloroflexota bacterium]